MGMSAGVLATVIARHAQNLLLCSRMRKAGFVEGAIFFPRPSAYRISGDLFLVNGCVAVLLAALTFQAFLAGMAMMLILMGVVHHAKAGELAKAAEAGHGGAAVRAGLFARPAMRRILIWIVLFVAFLVWFVWNAK